MQNNIKPIKINKERLQKFINDFAEIGKTDKGGVTRLSLTDVDKEARDLFIDLAEKAGCSIKIDIMGNIFARRSGLNNNLNPILIGSHIDSQPQGGRFDGIYGVLAGLEAIYSMNDQNINTQRAIDLVSWTNEEGARFAPPMIGSAVFAGITSLEKGLACKDDNGLTIKDELDRIGYAGSDDFKNYKAHSSLEIHIEQGPILENSNNTIGIVTGTMGIKWYDVNIYGIASHSGTTPMNLRKDALLGLSQAVEAINKIGFKYIPDGRATVGKIEIKPNSRNVIPGEVYFSVEFRHPDISVIEKMEKELYELIEKIGITNNLSYGIKNVLKLNPVKFNEKCISVIEKITKELEYTYQKIISGAGHDSCNVNQIAPTAMIFIPCIDGISHNEAENITEYWSEAGANVLLNSLIYLANSKD